MDFYAHVLGINKYNVLVWCIKVLTNISQKSLGVLLVSAALFVTDVLHFCNAFLETC